MTHKTHLGSVLIATTSFIGGIAAGLLLAPRSGSKNRQWISDHATELSDWMDTQQKNARYKMNKELRRIRKHVQQGIRENFPDLYEATENIDLSGKDVV